METLAKTKWFKAAVILLLLILTIVIAKPLTSPELKGASVDKCPDVIFYGIRGTGQTSGDATKGFGREAASVVSKVTPFLDKQNLTYRYIASTYPAVSHGDETQGGYYGSVEKGATLFAEQINELSTTCKNSSLVAVGFSQGAAALHKGLQNLNKENASYIASVVLISDPLRNPKDPNVKLESFGKQLTSGGFDDMGGQDFFPEALSGRVLSVCHRADPVCNQDGVPVAGMVAHAFVYEWGNAEEKAAAWIVTNLVQDQLLETG